MIDFLGNDNVNKNSQSRNTTQHELRIRHLQKRESETVLVMQGGGSLGAYECGVYKALSKHGIKFDIVAGTSIGAVNAVIIAGSKSGHPDKDLEEFWLEVVETVTASIIPDNFRAIASSSYGALCGNPKVFSPTWFMPSRLSAIGNTVDFKSRLVALHLYDLTTLKTALGRYVDFSKLNSKTVPRVILTCTNIKNSEAVIFDSNTTNLDGDHVIACAGYPFYGIAWTEKDGRFLWDGALLSNTPLREVIDSSPRRDKQAYIVNLFPHIQDELPKILSRSGTGPETLCTPTRRITM